MPVITEIESYYDILENEDNQLLIAIKARDSQPDSPSIIYDGNDHALFYRDSTLAIVLDYIHPEVRQIFKEAQEVLIAEFVDSSIIREYLVPVKQVNKVPAVV